jgi:hypothetical protein
MIEDVVDGRLGHMTSDRDVRTLPIVEVDETVDGAEMVAHPCAGYRE